MDTPHPSTQSPSPEGKSRRLGLGGLSICCSVAAWLFAFMVLIFGSQGNALVGWSLILCFASSALAVLFAIGGMLLSIFLRFLKRESQREGLLLYTGFTLGLLSFFLHAWAVPSFIESPSMAKRVRAKTDMRSLAVGLESYYANYSMYPRNLFALTTPMPYVQSLGRDPYAPEKEGMYHYQRVAKGWILWSPGPDWRYDLTEVNIGRIYDSRTTEPTHALVLLTYDPTNGSVSTGDIWRMRQ